MNAVKKILLLLLLMQLVACRAEIGSEKWCSQLEAKAKGDWTMNEAKNYARHCLFKADQ